MSTGRSGGAPWRCRVRKLILTAVAHQRNGSGWMLSGSNRPEAEIRARQIADRQGATPFGNLPLGRITLLGLCRHSTGCLHQSAMRRKVVR